MSLLVLSPDWELVDQLQYWFESQAAARELHWFNRIEKIHAPLPTFAWLLIDERLPLHARDLKRLGQLEASLPTVWLTETTAEGSDAGSANISGVYDQTVVGRHELSRETLIRARQRATTLLAHTQQPAPPTSGSQQHTSFGRQLKRLLKPLDQDVQSLKRTLGWMHEDWGRLHGNPSPVRPQTSALESELSALRRRTARLSHQLDRLTEISDLLGEQYAVRRCCFDVGVLLREILPKLDRVAETIVDPRHRLAEECLAFADPRQVRMSLLESIERLKADLPAGTELELEIRHFAADETFQVIVWDPTPMNPDRFAELSARWRAQQWDLTEGDPEFLMGLGLCRERLRHNGGELRLVREMGRGTGLVLELPEAGLSSIFRGYQAFMNYRMPKLEHISQFHFDLLPELCRAPAISTTQEFLQEHLGTHTWIVPVGRFSWIVLAPILAEESGEFLEWVLEQWDNHLQALERLDRNPIADVNALQASFQNQLALADPPAAWLQQVQIANPQNFAAVSDQPVIVISDFDPDVLKGLTDHLLGAGCQVQTMDSTSPFWDGASDHEPIVVDLRQSTTDAFVQLDQLTREGLARNVYMLSGDLRAQTESLEATTQELRNLQPRRAEPTGQDFPPTRIPARPSPASRVSVPASS